VALLFLIFLKEQGEKQQWKTTDFGSMDALSSRRYLRIGVKKTTQLEPLYQ
jgi:hypothetical protein